MGEFDPEKFREAFARAKLMAYIVRSTNADKEKRIIELRRLIDLACDLAFEIAA